MNKMNYHPAEDAKYAIEFARKRIEKQNNSETYPPLERIERKLDAIINWINWFAKEYNFNATTKTYIGEIPTIDFDDCERKDEEDD